MELANVVSLLFVLLSVKGDVIVYTTVTHEMAATFSSVQSTFGASIPIEGLRGLVVYSDPPDACTPIKPPPNYADNFLKKWIVLIQRNSCTFQNKVHHAELAGYSAAIIHNVNSSTIRAMALMHDSEINIPSVFIDSASGLEIKENYLYKDGYYILINNEGMPPFLTSAMLLILSGFLGVAFLLFLIFLGVRWIRHRRQQQRERLPRASLRALTVRRFKKDDPYDVCAICLEEYVENEKLRVLPCQHAYHCHCIDKWLTTSRRVCPCCKRRVFAGRERGTDSDSDSDTDDERTPLTRSAARRPRSRPLERSRPSTSAASAASNSSSSSSTYGSMISGTSDRALRTRIENLYEQLGINTAAPPIQVVTSSQHSEPRPSSC